MLWCIDTLIHVPYILAVGKLRYLLTVCQKKEKILDSFYLECFNPFHIYTGLEVKDVETCVIPSCFGLDFEPLVSHSDSSMTFE